MQSLTSVFLRVRMKEFSEVDMVAATFTSIQYFLTMIEPWSMTICMTTALVGLTRAASLMSLTTHYLILIPHSYQCLGRTKPKRIGLVMLAVELHSN